jgi:hypothetical protein
VGILLGVLADHLEGLHLLYTQVVEKTQTEEIEGGIELRAS